jgi:hypothetical protein
MIWPTEVVSVLGVENGYWRVTACHPEQGERPRVVVVPAKAAPRLTAVPGAERASLNGPAPICYKENGICLCLRHFGRYDAIEDPTTGRQWKQKQAGRQTVAPHAECFAPWPGLTRCLTWQTPLRRPKRANVACSASPSGQLSQPPALPCRGVRSIVKPGTWTWMPARRVARQMSTQRIDSLNRLSG